MAARLIERFGLGVGPTSAHPQIHLCPRQAVDPKRAVCAGAHRRLGVGSRVYEWLVAADLRDGSTSRTEAPSIPGAGAGVELVVLAIASPSVGSRSGAIDRGTGAATTSTRMMRSAPDERKAAITFHSTSAAIGDVEGAVSNGSSEAREAVQTSMRIISVIIRVSRSHLDVVCEPCLLLRVHDTPER